MLGPIFDREWLTLPRRSRHYLMRSAFLGGMWVLVLTIWQTTVGWEVAATLGDNARFGMLAFQVLTIVQLLLVLFFASISAVSAVAQEKDRRTFILLLITDLRDYEIVLGKLMGSLLQIGIVIAGSLPLWALLMLLGGIAPHQLVQALIVLLTAAFAAGSLANLIALWRERTFQSLALTGLFLILYLLLVHGLSLLTLAGVDPRPIEVLQSWLQPFLALHQVLDPPLDVVPAIPAAYGFGLMMLAVSVLLNWFGMLKLRVWNPSGEPIMQRESDVKAKEEVDRMKAHAAPGGVREVWENPVLWREVRTRAYGRRPLLVKIAYFAVLLLVCYYALGATERRDWMAAQGLVPVGILSLLLISAQAVTSITSERDIGALDLLLVTDLSPREFIFGKVWGILYNTKEYLLPPLILAGIYAYRGMLGDRPAQSPRAAAIPQHRVVRLHLPGHGGAHGLHPRPGHPRRPAHREQPPRRPAHPRHRLLPLHRHPRLHLPHPHQRDLRVSMAQLRRLPLHRRGRTLVGPQRRQALHRPHDGGLDLPHRRLLHHHQRPHRQARTIGIDRPAHSRSSSPAALSASPSPPCSSPWSASST